MTDMQEKKWDIEEYKKQVFKTDGEANPVTIGDVWDTVPRRKRREIQRLVAKGRNPDFAEYLGY